MFMVKVIKAKKEHLDILCAFANKLWQADETQHKSELGKILNSDFAVFFIVYEKNLPVGFAQCQLRNDSSDCELENKDSIRFHTAENFKIANRIMCFIKKL